MKKLAAFMIRARKARGITQKEMGIAMGYSGSYLSHIEAMRKPIPYDFIKKVHDVINLSPDEILELQYIIQCMYENGTNNQKERFSNFKRDFRQIIEEFFVKLSSGIMDSALIQRIRDMLDKISEIFNTRENEPSMI